ncbi:MAG: hypothetical protein A2017_14170 [Lentisphaerae bacterium GWF2_44_16]|nr:MAG: hypothetical protein A2017_14170 [Lentisphaerae bacterium GWF2_44_16]
MKLIYSLSLNPPVCKIKNSRSMIIENCDKQLFCPLKKQNFLKYYADFTNFPIFSTEDTCLFIFIAI